MGSEKFETARRHLKRDREVKSGGERRSKDHLEKSGETLDIPETIPQVSHHASLDFYFKSQTRVPTTGLLQNALMTHFM